MVDAIDVMAECERRLIILYRDGDKLMAQPLCPEVGDFDPGLEDAIRTHKTRILEVLDYQVGADRLLLESTGRLAARWPLGCLLEGEEWEQHEQAVRDAYWLLSTAALRDALKAREAFAQIVFDRFRTEAL
jgi:hypothetical protein